MTPSEEPLRGLPTPRPAGPDDEDSAPGPEEQNHTGVIRDRRRPLRDLAGRELQAMSDADKVSLVAYWASVAPAAFLLAREAFDADTRW